MYAKIKENQIIQFPYTFVELQQDNPYTNYGSNINVAEIFPTTEAATIYGYVLHKVIDDDPPSCNPRTHTATLQFPIVRDDVWVREWLITPISDELLSQQTKIQSDIVYRKQAQLLEESASLLISDAPIDKNLYTAYLRALQDIPKQDGFPWNVIWPVKPR